jgi:hypothetical protein
MSWTVSIGSQITSRRVRTSFNGYPTWQQVRAHPGRPRTNAADFPQPGLLDEARLELVR